MEQRPLGQSDLHITPVALGCWPIAGMTSLNVNQQDSRLTIEAAVEAGINFFDTAYGYGLAGESEGLLADVLGTRRHECVIATKAGLGWDTQGKRVLDASPERLRSQCETSLRRLRMDYVDVLYLHAPDPARPIEQAAATLRELIDDGKTLAVGVSNVTLTQLQAFQRECPVTVVQPPYNLLMRQIERDLLPYCLQQQIGVAVYWPLMKGLLAGKLARDHQFQAGDGRAKYPMFQGHEWQRNHDLLDDLRQVADSAGCTLAQLAVQWVLRQPGITAALCGAKRAAQIQETAAATKAQLSDQQWQAVASALERRGEAVSISAV